MKTIFLTLFLLLTTGFIKAQTPGRIWGTTPSGGKYGGGTIFFHDPSNGKDSVVHHFNNPYMKNPYYGKLLLTSDGNYYGLASSSMGVGGVFKYTPDNKIVLLNDFNGNLAYPYGSLIQANDGYLYGLCSSGGGAGNIFRFDPGTNDAAKLIGFNMGGAGSNPYGSLMQAKDGFLYGLTSTAGINNGGALFKCDLNGNITPLHYFATGSSPNADVIQASDGSLYGMTPGAGANGKGYVFRLDTNSTFSIVFDFDSINGANPYGNLIQASDGNFYGMTVNGGVYNLGVVFKIDQAGVFTKLIDFDRSNGANPYGDLMEGSDGLLYGLTSGGGNGNSGSAFSMDFSGSLTSIYYFSNGESPRGTLVEMANGNLLGMTLYGGYANAGYVFQMPKTAGNSLLSTTSFFYTPEGCSPFGALLQAGNGTLYGSTNYGGLSNNGTLFKIDPYSGYFQQLAVFNGSKGANPNGSLVEVNGSLYGTTYSGGANNQGVIFKYDTAGHVLDTVGTFNGLNGMNAGSGLIRCSDGLLYGTTPQGGVNYYGNIFKFDPSNDQLDTLVSFDGTNANYPLGRLLEGADGNFYGMSNSGGVNGNGNIYKCSKTGQLTSLYDFGPNTYPNADLIQGINGNLYGMTPGGGTNNMGQIFMCTTTGSFTTLYNFTGSEAPYGSLLKATTGNFYALASAGGANNLGLLFEFDPTNSNYTNQLSLSVKSGYYPYDNTMIETVEKPTFDSLLLCGKEGIALFANINGAQPPLSYSWSGGSSNDTIQAIVAGNYSLSVTDAQGITVTSSIFIQKHDTLSVTAGSDIHYCPGDTVHLLANSSGGEGNVTYNWVPGNLNSSNPAIYPTNSLSYTVSITDAVGCTKSAVQQVINDGCTTADLLNEHSGNSFDILPNPNSGAFKLNFNGSDGQAKSVTISDGIGRLIYKNTLKDGPLSIDLTGLQKGTYFIIVENESGKMTKRFIVE